MVVSPLAIEPVITPHQREHAAVEPVKWNWLLLFPREAEEMNGVPMMAFRPTNKYVTMSKDIFYSRTSYVTKGDVSCRTSWRES
jgi:hypothetical protein